MSVGHHGATDGGIEKRIGIDGHSVNSEADIAMSELDKLRKENKKLRRLLKDAVELLNKYKDVVQNVGAAPKKKKAKKKSKSVQPS